METLEVPKLHVSNGHDYISCKLFCVEGHQKKTFLVAGETSENLKANSVPKRKIFTDVLLYVFINLCSTVQT